MYTILTIDEASRRSGVAKEYLMAAIENGELEASRITINGYRCIQITDEDFDEFVEYVQMQRIYSERQMLRREIQERLDRLEQLDYKLYCDACFREQLNEKFRGIEL